ncbi:beta-glucosidase BglX [Paratractidigestivibacter sp.]|uniref:beta-glucosidase BglX n=1 Tax=Paratractidigestivibacter sp. TaxID=2847316 RepID=UPI002AC8A788|nr:beta-glucosidase BglX [Paratractidigestivibacter sp.]
MNHEDLLALLGKMTLKEKVGQLVQLDGGCFGAGDMSTGPREKLGVTQEDVDVCGSVLNVLGAEEVRRIQDTYLERSRLKIPLVFMADVIYGYQTCYPIPLGLGATWDPDLIRDDYRLIAGEAVADGCMVTFSPPVDVVRDARWGRCLEMPGEDPYLSSRFATAMVEGFHGDGAPERSIACCVKHFAGYGAPEAGREYNTVDMSEWRFRNEYLAPYKAAVDAGCELVMTSFNTVEGIPATANKWLMDDVLRGEWGFDGPVITDYAAVAELIGHGVAANAREATRLAMNATVDIDMKTPCYAHELEGLVADGEVSMEQVDAACLRVLELKNKLGLFENPYRTCSPERRVEVTCSPERLASARKTCGEALVLLKNEGDVLPLDAGEDGPRVALIGPYANSRDIIGMWAIHADKSRSVTLADAFEEVLGPERFGWAKGCETLDDYSELGDFGKYVGITSGVDDGPSADELETEALALAAAADVVVMALGEHMLQSGEGGARTDITLPAPQKRLLARVRELGKPVVLVLFNGRPLALTDVLDDCDAVLEAWFPGTAGGRAVADVLFGDVNPSGRLTVSFPHNVGQEPLYYAQFSTGRPAKGSAHSGRFVSRYMDAPNEALFPFGYGLSYHTARYENLCVGTGSLRAGEKLRVSVDVTNESQVAGIEVVQLYIHDVAASRVRPMLELRDFARVELAASETRTVEFEIGEDQLRFWTPEHAWASEPGSFEVFVGPNSRDLLAGSFELI